MKIRPATKSDQTAIHNLYMKAFSTDEQEPVATLAIALLSNEQNPNAFAYMAEVGNNIVGHIAFSPVTLTGEGIMRGFILSPLAVSPDYQQQKIGSALIEHGISQLKKLDADIVFVYGDPAYYGRFGFDAAAANGYVPPYKLQYPFGWLALSLNTASRLEKTGHIACIPALQHAALW